MSNLYLELQAAYLGNASVRDLQSFCRFSDLQAAKFLMISPETLRRWKNDRPVNPMALRLLAMRAGFLPYPGWEGWILRDGLLYAPGLGGTGFGSGEVAALPWLYQRLAAHETSVRQHLTPVDPLRVVRRSA